jgi:hypothetical protein
VIAASDSQQQKRTLLTADDLLKFFNAKIEAVLQSTGKVPVQSSLPLATAELLEFELCTQEEVMRVICNAHSKSCCQDPVTTNIFKEYLPEILPFVTSMCNVSLQQGTLPVRQCHAVVMPRLKKAYSDPSDAKNY